MSKGIKFKNDVYLDSSGITHKDNFNNRFILKDLLNGNIGDLIQVYTSASFHSITAVSIIPFTSVQESIGSSFTLQANGSIKYNGPTRKVRLNANLCPRYDTPAGPFGLIARKNNAQFRIALDICVAGEYKQNTLNTIVTLNNNDVVDLQFYWEAGTMKFWGLNLYGPILTLEVIK